MSNDGDEIVQDLTNLTLVETTKGRDDDGDPVRCFTLNDDDGRIVVELQLMPNDLAIFSATYSLFGAGAPYVVFLRPSVAVPGIPQRPRRRPDRGTPIMSEFVTAATTATISDHMRHAHGEDLAYAVSAHPSTLLAQHDRNHQQFSTFRIDHVHAAPQAERVDVHDPTPDYSLTTYTAYRTGADEYTIALGPIENSVALRLRWESVLSAYGELRVVDAR